MGNHYTHLGFAKSKFLISSVFICYSQFVIIKQWFETYNKVKYDIIQKRLWTATNDSGFSIWLSNHIPCNLHQSSDPSNPAHHDWSCDWRRHGSTNQLRRSRAAHGECWWLMWGRIYFYTISISQIVSDHTLFRPQGSWYCGHMEDNQIFWTGQRDRDRQKISNKKNVHSVAVC